jgi:hypothetical protein
MGDNIVMNLKEIGWEGVNRIHTTQDRDQWWVLANVVMNLQVQKKGGGGIFD